MDTGCLRYCSTVGLVEEVFENPNPLVKMLMKEAEILVWLVEVPATNTFEPTDSALDVVAWPSARIMVEALVETVVVAFCQNGAMVSTEPFTAVTVPTRIPESGRVLVACVTCGVILLSIVFKARQQLLWLQPRSWQAHTTGSDNAASRHQCAEHAGLHLGRSSTETQTRWRWRR